MFRKLKALLTGEAEAPMQIGADEVPPVDVNTPVTNPNLVDAIKPDMHGIATNKEKSQIKVLNTSDENDNLYLPLFTDWARLESIGISP